jgi:hypothetical protein
MQDRARQRRRCKEEASNAWQYQMSKDNARQGEVKRGREATQERQGLEKGKGCAYCLPYFFFLRYKAFLKHHPTFQNISALNEIFEKFREETESIGG